MFYSSENKILEYLKDLKILIFYNFNFVIFHVYLVPYRSGVLLYFGDFAYVALELFDGRVAATFYIGNYPSSHLYSYAVGGIFA